MKLSKEMCIDFFSKQPVELQQWLVTVVIELNNAKQKHPAWPITPERAYKPKGDYIHAAAIVSEEAGELTRAALQFHYEGGRFYDMHKEAIQTAAMALRFLTSATDLISTD